MASGPLPPPASGMKFFFYIVEMTLVSNEALELDLLSAMSGSPIGSSASASEKMVHHLAQLVISNNDVSVVIKSNGNSSAATLVPEVLKSGVLSFIR